MEVHHSFYEPLIKFTFLFKVAPRVQSNPGRRYSILNLVSKHPLIQKYDKNERQNQGNPCRMECLLGQRKKQSKIYASSPQLI